METLRANINIPGSATKQNNKFEVEGLSSIKQYIEEYLNSESSNCTEVRLYLEKVKVDDALLLNYLRGRKNNSFIAWDTLRRYAENRFHFYPEVFPGDDIPEKVRELILRHVVGMLKNRDKLNRRIVFVDMTKWDANVHTLEDITTAAVLVCEKFWQEPDTMKHGAILVENAKGFGLTHAKQHTMPNVLRLRNAVMFSFPIKIKGAYYLNMPKLFSLVLKMSKPLFPLKLRSRLFMYSTNQTPSELLDITSPEILPTCLGGKLSVQEAAEDITFYENKIK